jgi:hypothetical protein
MDETNGRDKWADWPTHRAFVASVTPDWVRASDEAVLTGRC